MQWLCELFAYLEQHQHYPTLRSQACIRVCARYGVSWQRALYLIRPANRPVLEALERARAAREEGGAS